jgi:hypothetical protein
MDVKERLKRRVLNAADRAERWFGMTDAQKAKFVVDDPQVRELMDHDDVRDTVVSELLADLAREVCCLRDQTAARSGVEPEEMPLPPFISLVIKKRFPQFSEADTEPLKAILLQGFGCSTA